jgi:hypothetical protein
VRRSSLLACAVVIGAAVVTVLCGCNSGGAPARQQESNLKKLALFYGPYQGQHQGALPPNEQALKDFIKSQTLLLESQRITDVDAMFVSERDKQPYVILYAGDELGTDGPAGQPVVAYEKRGVGGKRYVASTLGAVEEVDDAKFREWVKNPK